MSIILSASPYVSEEGGGRKDGKRISTLRSGKKKIYPKPPLDKDPLPMYSSYTDNNSLTDHYSSFQKITESYFPSFSSISESSPADHSLDTTKQDKTNIQAKKDSSPEMASFYQTTPSQQSKLSSALNKLFGKNESMSDVEGMSTFHPDIHTTEDDSPPLIPRDISNPNQSQKVYNTNVVSASQNIPTQPLAPIPTEYLHSSYVNPYSGYEESYTSSIIPPELAAYSYPGKASNQSGRSRVTPVSDHVSLSSSSSDDTNALLLEKINYMIYLLEQQKPQKSKHTTEEFVLYSFFGVFMIYIVDSFSRSGRYIR